MTLTSKFSKTAAILVAAAGLFGANAAFADQCPAGKTGMDVTKPGPMTPSGVTDTVISNIDLKAYGSAGHQLRMRRLVVQPGGIVPWHSHQDRPALIYVMEGTVTEYASNCAVPIVHKTGDISTETKEVSHWWKNTGKTVAKLLSSDVFHDQKTASME